MPISRGWAQNPKLSKGFNQKGNIMLINTPEQRKEFVMLLRDFLLTIKKEFVYLNSSAFNKESSSAIYNISTLFSEIMKDKKVSARVSEIKRNFEILASSIDGAFDKRTKCKYHNCGIAGIEASKTNQEKIKNIIEIMRGVA